MADTSELAANARARFAKKGWSEAKIDRAIAAKQAPRSTVPCEQRPDTPRDLLGDLLSRLSATEGGVRMLLHFYRGSPDSEQASGSVGNDLDVRKVVEGAEFPVDTLIQITHAS